jgi:hypothetical protein
MKVKFENIELIVPEDVAHIWLPENSLAAQGYGVSEDNIRYHKSKNADDFVKDKHFITVSNPHGNPRETIRVIPNDFYETLLKVEPRKTRLDLAKHYKASLEKGLSI